MLRISKLTDYALLIMSQMAKDPLAILSASVIAKLLHLTVPTVSKILKMLAEANLVSSIRGAEGGYRLSRLPAEISIAEIIAAMEGEFAMTECCEIASACLIDSVCAMRDNWQKINKLVQIFLSQLTILDMLTTDMTAKSMLNRALQGISDEK